MDLKKITEIIIEDQKSKSINFSVADPLFQKWSGIDARKFLKYLSSEYYKSILNQLSNNDYSKNFTNRIKIKTDINKNNISKIVYSFEETAFGEVLIASSSFGISYIKFTKNSKEQALNDFKKFYPKINYLEADPEQIHTHQQALSIFNKDRISDNSSPIYLYLIGTLFQTKIWTTLLKVPFGCLVSYSKVAETANYTGAYRAVGTAVGQNPLALLIPCHRVIRSNGETGEYHWGSIRKKEIIGWEAAKMNLINKLQ